MLGDVEEEIASLSLSELKTSAPTEVIWLWMKIPSRAVRVKVPTELMRPLPPASRVNISAELTVLAPNIFMPSVESFSVSPSIHILPVVVKTLACTLIPYPACTESVWKVEEVPVKVTVEKVDTACRVTIPAMLTLLAYNILFTVMDPVLVVPIVNPTSLNVWTSDASMCISFAVVPNPIVRLVVIGFNRNVAEPVSILAVEPWMSTEPAIIVNN